LLCADDAVELSGVEADAAEPAVELAVVEVDVTGPSCVTVEDVGVLDVEVHAVELPAEVLGVEADAELSCVEVEDVGVLGVEADVVEPPAVDVSCVAVPCVELAAWGVV
jgi:hypothetical protein